jgi:hypothetical protein
VALALASLGSVGCRRGLEPEPPDPDRPIAAVECDASAPVGFSSVGGDSLLDTPPWSRFCALCPPLAIDATYSSVDRVSGWSADGLCALSLPVAPLGDAETVTVTLDQDDRSGTFDFPQERGEAPGPTLALGTWLLPVSLDNLVAPPLSSLPGSRTLASPGLLLALDGDPTTGQVTASFGVAQDDGSQDPCAPTVPLATPLTLLDGFVAGPLDAGAEVPLPLLGPIDRGALHAAIAPDGSALSSVALMGVADATLLELVTGAPVAEHCAALLAETGLELCGPCSDPADGIADLPTCTTVVWEWPTAASAPPLQPVDPTALPPECTPP